MSFIANMIKGLSSSSNNSNNKSANINVNPNLRNFTPYVPSHTYSWEDEGTTFGGLAENKFSNVPLDNILQKEDQALEILRQEISNKGWALIQIPERLQEPISAVRTDLMTFFNGTDKPKLSGGVSTRNQTPFIILF